MYGVTMYLTMTLWYFVSNCENHINTLWLWHVHRQSKHIINICLKSQWIWRNH